MSPRISVILIVSFCTAVLLLATVLAPLAHGVPLYSSKYSVRNPWRDNTASPRYLRGAIAKINFWNVRWSRGYASIYSRGDVIGFETELSHVELVDSSAVVAGYPSVIFGRNPWLETYVTYVGAAFPIRLSRDEARGLYMCFTVKKLLVSRGKLNLALDIWLTKAGYLHYRAEYMPKLEVMIWLHGSEGFRPAGSYLGLVSVPCYIYSVSYCSEEGAFCYRLSGLYTLAVVYYSYDKARKHAIVSYVLLSDYYSLEKGRPVGMLTHAVLLYPFIVHAASLAQEDLGGSIGDYVILGVELGTEFVPEDGAAEFEWELEGVTLRTLYRG